MTSLSGPKKSGPGSDLPGRSGPGPEMFGPHNDLGVWLLSGSGRCLVLLHRFSLYTFRVPKGTQLFRSTSFVLLVVLFQGRELCANLRFGL